MKSRTVIRPLLVISILLLCGWLGIHTFGRLYATESTQAFNLYTLVPQDATLVFETNDVTNLLKEIRRRKEYSLYVPDWFSRLNNQSHGGLEKLFASLDKHGSKKLISFHESGTQAQQIFYCRLWKKDYRHLISFFNSELTAGFSSKKVVYHDEHLQIFPLGNNLFMTIYLTPNFFVASLQKNLVEQVVDAYRNNKSLMNQRGFQAAYFDKYWTAENVLYLRASNLNVGGRTDWKNGENWCKFDVSWTDKEIFCSGPIFCVDSIARRFEDVLCKQEPMYAIPGQYLPDSTFSYTCWAISDMDVWLSYISDYQKGCSIGTDSVCMGKGNNREYTSFLEQYAIKNIISVSFISQESSMHHSYEVVLIPLNDIENAEKHLLLRNRGDKLKGSYVQQNIEQNNSLRFYPFFCNSLMSYVYGETIGSESCYVCFYKGCLLMAQDKESLVAYIQTVERGDVLASTSVELKDEGQYSFVYAMAADIGAVSQLKNCVNMLPELFCRNVGSLNDHILNIRYQLVNNKLHAHIILSYE